MNQDRNQIPKRQAYLARNDSGQTRRYSLTNVNGDIETGLHSNDSSRKRSSLTRPERQPIPKPGDPHYYTYMKLNGSMSSIEQNEQLQKGTALRRRNTPMKGEVKKSRRKAIMNGLKKEEKSSFLDRLPGPWTVYTRIVTFWAPPPLLKLCGIPDKQIQTAWREKIALVSIIVMIMGTIGFLTFGLQQVLCGLSGTENRVKFNGLKKGNVIIGGYAYDISKFKHPDVGKIDDGNILGAPINAEFRDLSLLFQNPNDNCKKVLRYADNFADDNGNVANVFPCKMVSSQPPGDKVDPSDTYNQEFCHNSNEERSALKRQPKKVVYYSWDDIMNKKKDMIVYNGVVLDLSRLDWLLPQVKLPSIIKKIKGGKYRGQDMSMYFAKENPTTGECLRDLTKVGDIDTASFGCMISNVILYVSLVVILGAVFAKFFMALYFGWFMSRNLGFITPETPEERKKRLEKIEDWSDYYSDGRAREVLNPQYTVAPGMANMNQQRTASPDGTATANNSNDNIDNAAPPVTPRKHRWLPSVSRFSQFNPGEVPVIENQPAKRGRVGVNPNSVASGYFNSLYMTRNPNQHFEDNPNTAGISELDDTTRYTLDLPKDSAIQNEFMTYPSGNMNQTNITVNQAYKSHQDPITAAGTTVDDSPFDFPLAYTLLLVTCYSEGVEGIRTTLDSLAGTDYPGSHKCIFVICDGLIKGAGEDMYTPDVCLSMMKDFVIPPDRVQPYTYVAIASGAKRRNMAKIYAGYYAPSEDSPEATKREPVPMILVVKCGAPEEANEKKPGNRGKRDSQVLLMRFLQHVMFDDRMTELEYELFNAMWNVTKVTPDNFEICLMVDADTKVYGDSVTRMVATMVRDPQIMGLCGETKIANKRDSWVSAIQVFEYYISHHQAKAFESVFGGVTCLPGCFCMYRIKAPKGTNNYWVPILSNPNIVELYSEHVVDTLHKKNLLLLGEDRYLTTLMLKTFPKRKMMFVPSAVCKTVVPDEFKVLLSQRRRWINSTVHNLMELVLVKDLCGTFCLSMQFVIFMELVGTVALPAAISFTIYIVIISTFTRPVPYLPLALLACILLLPAVLIGLTTRKMVYVGWMFIYLFALPIWNFVLPAYAYWHFDDFSWGETRKVTGEGKDTGHGDGEGEFDQNMIIRKHWCEFEAEKREKTKKILNETPHLRKVALSIYDNLYLRHLSLGNEFHHNSMISMLNKSQTLGGTSSFGSLVSSHRSVISTSKRSETHSHTSSENSVLFTPGIGQVSQLQAAITSSSAHTLEDTKRMSHAADTLEKLGYMTPLIIPTIASTNSISRMANSSSLTLSSSSASLALSNRSLSRGGTPQSKGFSGSQSSLRNTVANKAHQYPFLNLPPPPAVFQIGTQSSQLTNKSRNSSMVSLNSLRVPPIQKPNNNSNTSSNNSYNNGKSRSYGYAP
ncbi:hypothetical protein H4219_002069 [Mycoemilia scoparia]|uniref:chitin synthase n=1 Tax=Mycoemilia scoparia TaxID=417184 RepID=A0A9W8A3F8_9FUNG|nr:hypothetical protein H4219_002069 [Mycoemilia scoparia]